MTVAELEDLIKSSGAKRDWQVVIYVDTDRRGFFPLERMKEAFYCPRNNSIVDNAIDARREKDSCPALVLIPEEAE